MWRRAKTPPPPAHRRSLISLMQRCAQAARAATQSRVDFEVWVMKQNANQSGAGAAIVVSGTGTGPAPARARRPRARAPGLARSRLATLAIACFLISVIIIAYKLFSRPMHRSGSSALLRDVRFGGVPGVGAVLCAVRLKLVYRACNGRNGVTGDWGGLRRVRK
jgi:hypothetical protein